MHTVLLALVAIVAPNADNHLNRLTGYVLVASAKCGMSPQRVGRLSHPDRARQVPDPAGSVLTFLYDKYDARIVWELRKAPGDPSYVLRFAGNR